MSIEAGIYRARGIEGSDQFGFAKTGTEQVSIDLELIEIGQTVTTILMFSDAATPYSIDRLKALGWEGGDTFAGTGKETLIVANGSGAPINVTLASFKSVNGLAVPSRVVAVAAGATKHIAVGKEHVDPADGNVDVTYSSATDVTVGVTRASS